MGALLFRERRGRNKLSGACRAPKGRRTVRSNARPRAADGQLLSGRAPGSWKETDHGPLGGPFLLYREVSQEYNRTA